MLSDENFDILIGAIQEKMTNTNRDFSNPQDILIILKLHWDEITDFVGAKAANEAAELRRLQAEQPVQEVELQKTKDRITELGG